MAIARTSKRLVLRTEASARFERGCDPAGIDRAVSRFIDLLALTAGASMRVAAGTIDVVGNVPGPVELEVRPARINALLGTALPTVPSPTCWPRSESSPPRRPEGATARCG